MDGFISSKSMLVFSIIERYLSLFFVGNTLVYAAVFLCFDCLSMTILSQTEQIVRYTDLLIVSVL